MSEAYVDSGAFDAVIATPVVASYPYTTTFPLTENPISEAGRWTRGGTDGLLWTNPRTTGGNVIGTHGGVNFDDSLAHLKNFPADHAIEGTIFRTGSFSPTQEVELHVRHKITANSARGYECLWSYFGSFQIFRWGGPYNSFIEATTHTVTGMGTPVNGDRFKASVTGTVISIYKNDVLMGTCSIAPSNFSGAATWTDGDPGIGFFTRDTSGAQNLQYGFQSITATANSVLANAAAGMVSGAWLNLTGANLPAGLNLFVDQAGGNVFSGGAGGLAIAYCSKFARDPNNKKFYFVGSDHNARTILLAYDEATNTWAQPAGATTVPWGYPAGGTANHGYEGTVYDPVNNKLWHNPPYAAVIRDWNSAASWGSVNLTPSSNATSGTGCAEWFPERGKILVFQIESVPNGRLIEIDPVARTTSILAATVPATSDYSYFIRYSAARAMCYFGGGSGSNASRAVYRVNAAGTVLRLDDCPVNLGPAGSGSSHTFVNPSNGNLIVYSSTSSWRECNPTLASGAQWSVKTPPVSVLTANTNDGSAYGVAACPMESPYGVVAFIKNYSRTSAAQMWLWKP